MKRIFVIALLAYSVIALCGCAGVSRKDNLQKEEALLEPQVTAKYNDLPSPSGFKFLPQDSYAFESAGVRVGVLKYQGKADVEQVVNFYKNQMPLYNWDLLNVVEYGELLMNFEREQETCIIKLLPKGRNITIIISLGPKSGTRPKKSENPVK